MKNNSSFLSKYNHTISSHIIPGYNIHFNLNSIQILEKTDMNIFPVSYHLQKPLTVNQNLSLTVLSRLMDEN